RTRFRMEATVGMTVDHPNLLRTYDHGTTDDVFGEMDYVVMELFRGIALHELLSVHGPLSWAMACDIISQAAEGLQYLHDRGMVHRDVKPDNLLIDEDGRVKLIDYGLALTNDAVRDGKVAEGGEEFTLTMLFGHDCLGTPDYMAPEQAENSLAADARSDVYALGCTFYTALVGKRPFPNGTRLELQASHREVPVPHVMEQQPGVPKDLDGIVAQMMAKPPEDRLPSMDSVVLKLAPYATRRPVRFKYDELLRARRRLAEKKSSISRKSSPARTTSGVRAAVLASHLATGVSTETVIDGATSTGIPRRTPKTSPSIPAASAAETAEQAIAAYESQPAGDAPIRARLVFPNGMEVPVRGMHLSIGRGRENDLGLPVADLSSQHCSLTFDGERWILRDHDSRNGVRVNGRKTKEVVLNPGDLITLGSTTHFRFEEPMQSGFSRTSKIAAALFGLALTATLIWFLLSAISPAG
ncbi:MAG: protein kinase, partial [Planctomycetaceae bacterium]|nr:protein kinase [Planctomycetaceae bacterium]